MTIPTIITAGETVSWQLFLSSYLPSNGWQLVYYFRSNNFAFDITANNDANNNFMVNLAPDDTANYPPGDYQWQSFAFQENKKHLVHSDWLIIKANLANPHAVSPALHITQVLSALEAMLEGKATRDQMSYSIAGRSLSRLSPSEILQWRDKYKVELVRFRRKEGMQHDQTIFVRF